MAFFAAHEKVKCQKNNFLHQQFKNSDRIHVDCDQPSNFCGQIFDLPGLECARSNSFLLVYWKDGYHFEWFVCWPVQGGLREISQFGYQPLLLITIIGIRLFRLALGDG